MQANNNCCVHAEVDSNCPCMKANAKRLNLIRNKTARKAIARIEAASTVDELRAQHTAPLKLDAETVSIDVMRGPVNVLRTLQTNRSKAEIVDAIISENRAYSFAAVNHFLVAAGAAQRVSRWSKRQLNDLEEQRKVLMRETRKNLLNIYWAMSEERMHKSYRKKIDYTRDSKLREFEIPRKDEDDDGDDLQTRIAKGLAKAKLRKRLRRRSPAKHHLAVCSVNDWIRDMTERNSYVSEGVTRRDEWMAEIEARTRTKQQRSNMSAG